MNFYYNPILWVPIWQLSFLNLISCILRWLWAVSQIICFMKLYCRPESSQSQVHWLFPFPFPLFPCISLGSPVTSFIIQIGGPNCSFIKVWCNRLILENSKLLSMTPMAINRRNKLACFLWICNDGIICQNLTLFPSKSAILIINKVIIWPSAVDLSTTSKPAPPCSIRTLKIGPWLFCTVFAYCIF